eukprot:scaffold1235_cov358-Prasinococcus_capsulatus_cf.AAC.13
MSAIVPRLWRRHVGRSLQVSTLLGTLAFQLVFDSLALKAGARYSPRLARWAQSREAREVRRTIVDLGKTVRLARAEGP